MAGIDKTYTDSYTDYKNFKDWANKQFLTFFNGYEVCIGNWVFIYEKEDFDGTELPIMNTPTWLDVYLIQNCPCKFVIDRMKIVYGKHFEKFKAMQFPSGLPDDYKKNRKVIIQNTGKTKYSLNNTGWQGHSWWIQCDSHWGYNSGWKTWVNSSLYLPCNTNTMHVKTVKSLIRQLRNMYLPSGLKFNLSGRLIGEEYKIVIK